MGVIRFFYWVFQNHPSVLHEISTSSRYNKNKKLSPIDTYLIDLNAIIHPVVRKHTIERKGDSLSFGKQEEIKKDVPDQELYDYICQEIFERVEIINPKKHLIIAIDGVAGISKQMQQRQRRYNRKYDGQGFDTNKITTGTEFMYNLSLYIQSYIKIQLKKRKWSHLTITFSSERVPGEGEHKLIQYLKTYLSITDVHCIDSPDADLIMLALGLLQYNLYIFRANSYDNVNCDYFLVDINKLREIVICLYKSKNEQLSSDDCIYRFILGCFMIGNDFLPHMCCLEIFNGAIEDEIELISGIKEPALELKNGIPIISLVLIREFLKKLSKVEWNLITRKHDNFQLYADNTYKEAKGDFETYKRLYYHKKLKVDNKCIDDVDRVCYYYLKTMQFVIQYYLKEIPDWQYCYPYYYAPFACDLTSFLERYHNEGEAKLQFTFEKHAPFTPLQQLLSILPYHSYYLLPTEYQKEAEKYKEQLQLTHIETDREGKKNDYEEIILVPLIDTKITNEITKMIKIRGYISHLNEPDTNHTYKMKIHILDNNTIKQQQPKKK